LCYKMPMKQEEFLKKVEAVLIAKIGKIIAGSVLKNNLSRMNKPVPSMDKSDMQSLIENITKAVSLFESHNESKLINEELKDLLKILD
jgi:hypothetical protein